MQEEIFVLRKYTWKYEGKEQHHTTYFQTVQEKYEYWIYLCAKMLQMMGMDKG